MMNKSMNVFGLFFGKDRSIGTIRSFTFGLLAISLCSLPTLGLAQTKILMRMDDMGISHGTNMATIKAYQNGIGTTAEVIVTGPWFEEAVRLLNENPGLDVGVHLALTSEWKNLKWRPLTQGKSFTDLDGYFLPMIWPNPKFQDDQVLTNQDWDIEEIEVELRTQIELAKRKIPHLSHLSEHMGCLGMNEDTKALLNRLADEYGLKVIRDREQMARFPKWSGNGFTHQEKVERFLAGLDVLEEKTYLVVGHLSLDAPETRAIGLLEGENVSMDRDGDYKMFTSDRLKSALRSKNIELISYREWENR